MQLTLDIPDDLAAALRAAHGDDLGRAALERLTLDGYRSGRLSLHQVERLLGFADRYQTEAWLGREGANWNYSLDDLDADRQTLDRLLAG
ncbi:MAG: UPF0175 family protein [Planctomycetaceae bacterium]